MARGDDAMSDLVQNRPVAVGETDEQIRARATRRINDTSDAEVGHGVTKPFACNVHGQLKVRQEISTDYRTADVGDDVNPAEWPAETKVQSSSCWP